MNMDYYQMATEADNRRRALLQVADRRRLVAQAGQATANRHHRHLSATVLYRLGLLLASWGNSLQARYDAAQIERAPLLYEG